MHQILNKLQIEIQSIDLNQINNVNHVDMDYTDYLGFKSKETSF